MGMGWISFLQLHVLQAWLSHRFSRLQITLAIPFDAQMTHNRSFRMPYPLPSFCHSFSSQLGAYLAELADRLSGIRRKADIRAIAKSGSARVKSGPVPDRSGREMNSA